MWSLFHIRSSRAACRCSRLLWNNRSSVNEDFPTVSFSMGPTCASNQPTKSLLKPNKLVTEQHKCQFITSSYNLSRSSNFPFAKRLKMKEPREPLLSGRVNSELQRLSLEELTEEAEDQKFYKTVKGPEVKPREDQESDILFGLAPCLLALSQTRRKAMRLFVKTSEGHQREAMQRVLEMAQRRGVQIQKVSKRELNQITGGRVHQGVCLQASPLRFVTEESSARSQDGGHHHPLWLVLDGVQDPMNLGAILRTSYFLGVDRVASSIHNSCPLTPVVSKASSGVMEVMEVYGYNNLAEIIKVKLKQGWQAVGGVGTKKYMSGVSVVSCSDFRISKPTLLLMGGEGFGLSHELHQLCDVFLTIPPRRDLHSGVDSLNVSVATGILLHSLLSSRGGN